MPNIMTQTSATAPHYAYANRYIHVVENKIFSATMTFQSNWNATAFLKTNGIGIAPYNPAINNARPMFNGFNVFYGAFSTGFYSLLGYSRLWNGYNEYAPAYFTPLDFIGTSQSAYSGVITIGPNQGGHNYSVSMRYAGGGYDETFVEPIVNFPGGHGLLSISGNFTLDQTDPPNLNQFAVTALTIV